MVVRAGYGFEKAPVGETPQVSPFAPVNDPQAVLALMEN